MLLHWRRSQGLKPTAKKYRIMNGNKMLPSAWNTAKTRINDRQTRTKAGPKGNLRFRNRTKYWFTKQYARVSNKKIPVSVGWAVVSWVIEWGTVKLWWKVNFQGLPKIILRSPDYRFDEESCWYLIKAFMANWSPLKFPEKIQVQHIFAITSVIDLKI